MPAPSNLVHQTTTGTGTGNLALVAVNGKQSFATAFGTGGTNVFDYFVSHRSAAEWERGTGSIDGVSGDLVRNTVIESSNANLAVTFSAGTKDIVNDVPAASQYFVGGPDVAVSDGGTGASDAAAARTNLGLVIGTDVQAFDADLSSWAGVIRAVGFDTFAATPSSANLSALVTGETGSGALVFATSPTLVTPALGTPSAAVLTNATGLPLAGVVDSTTEALGVGSLELGHASDTTLTRLTAKVVAVEGIPYKVPLYKGTVTNAASLTLDVAPATIGTFIGFELHLYEWAPATDADSLAMRFGDSAGIDTGATDYLYANLGIASNLTAVSDDQSSGNSMMNLTGFSQGNLSGETYNGVFWIDGNQIDTPNDGYNKVHGPFTTNRTDNSVVAGLAAGQRAVHIDLEDIQLFYAGGNIATGSFILFGIPA